MAVRRFVRIPSSTLYRDLAGEAVLLQIDTGEYFGLDEVGNRIWQLIVEVGDLDGVRERMIAEYDVDANELSADLDRLLADMVERKLVEVEERSSS